MTRIELARAIYAIAHITGEFTLRSGAVSNEYFDKYLFESKPEILSEIARHLSERMPKNMDVLAGLEMGGIPIVTALSLCTGLPSTFVRKKAKDYGTCKISEGAVIDGRHLLIVEDVVTSGGQVVLSANDLRQGGAIITSAICVIDRQAGGREALAEVGIELNALFTMAELKEAAGVL